MIIPTFKEDFDPDGRISGQLYCDTVSGKYLFKYQDVWCLSDSFPTVNGGFLTQFYTFNGRNYWQKGAEYLWFDLEKGYKRGNALGYEGSAINLVIDDFFCSTSSTLLGIYSNGEIIGCRYDVDQYSVSYIQSVEKVNGFYTYGAIHHDGQGWIIGTRNTGDWWEGDEPSGESYTFTKKGTAKENKTFIFTEFVQTNTSIYGFEVSVFYS